MVRYYLREAPHLFQPTVEAQFEAIVAERDAESEASASKAEGVEKTELVLYQYASLSMCSVSILTGSSPIISWAARAQCDGFAYCPRTCLSWSVGNMAMLWQFYCFSGALA